MKIIILIAILLIAFMAFNALYKKGPVASNALDTIAELFTNPTHISYENSHGSAPAGVNALSGLEQRKQNAGAPYVNQAYEQGNPQNTNPEFKKQP
jgi:hypothetical protein